MLSLILAAAAATAAPPAPAPAPDPVAIVDAMAQERGDRTPVLVLGTAHLSALPKDFDTTRFDPLMDRLAAWKPEAIAVEQLSGAQCDYIKARPFAYPTEYKNYCLDPSAARASVGLDGAGAEGEIEATLAAPSADRPPAVRRRLAALFLAVGEPQSALVQWLRLPDTERRSGDGLTDELAGGLAKRIGRLNESVLIAARLAARLGHERVWPVDDHTGNRATGPVDDAVFGTEMTAIWSLPAGLERRAAEEAMRERLLSGDLSVLDWYRTMNSPLPAEAVMRSDFGPAAGSTLPGNTGRKYLAYWETRNLRMVANLREVIGPGRRTLAIVGSSHVGYYDRYLGMTSDVELADPAAVLAD
ncbi:DUF5694 domain-containing protein [Tsuneonella amylolytica]|uniref:DUF5694 domain-containing protein n=1 Tax=Tsuneonella amylolytica TaxID=2338327 RepID=UPI000EA90D4F|nr:DUF5694 domain-containing protein [Tsuneonella amylolytica]